MNKVSFYTKAREEYLKNNFEKAFLLYRKGLEEGEVKCGYGLAVLYYNGKGINKDLQKANDLFKEYFPPIKELARANEAESQYIID